MTVFVVTQNVMVRESMKNRLKCCSHYFEANHRRKKKPPLKITPVDVPKGPLSYLFKFYDEGLKAISVTSVQSCIKLEYPFVLGSDDISISGISFDKFLFSSYAYSSVPLASWALSPYRIEVCSDESNTQFGQK